MPVPESKATSALSKVDETEYGRPLFYPRMVGQVPQILRQNEVETLGI